MTTRSRSLFRFSSRLIMLLFMVTVLLDTTGCSRTKPREHWWQFWRKPATASVYQPDLQILPPAEVPGEGGGQAKRLGPDTTLPPPPTVSINGTGIKEPEPLRQAPAGQVSGLKTVYFEFDSDQLTPETQQILDGDAEWLTANPGYQIQIQGHCDERGTVEYNYALGDRRAKAVTAYVISKGVDGSRLHTISYGEERPIDPGRGDAAWSKNRRVEFLVY